MDGMDDGGRDAACEQLLHALKGECDAYIAASLEARRGRGVPAPALWAGAVETQIAKMREALTIMARKPPWISDSTLDALESRMYHARLEFKMAARAREERAAAKGAEGKWLVKVNFPASCVVPLDSRPPEEMEAIVFLPAGSSLPDGTPVAGYTAVLPIDEHAASQQRSAGRVTLALDPDAKVKLTCEGRSALSVSPRDLRMAVSGSAGARAHAAHEAMVRDGRGAPSRGRGARAPDARAGSRAKPKRAR